MRPEQPRESRRDSPRLVVITNGNYFARTILEDLFRAHAPHIDRVLIITGDYHGRHGFRALWALAKTTALPYLLYKLFTVVVFAVAGAIWRNSAFGVDGLAKKYGRPLFFFTSIREQDAINCVAESKCDLIVSVSCPQRVGDNILVRAPLGGINTHVSLLPAYGGLAPYFWVLAEGQKRTGTTAHFMTKRFDEGPILEQAEMSIEPGDSSFALFYRLAKYSSPLVLHAADAALAGARGRPQALENASYRSHPSFDAYRSLRRRGHRLVRVREVVGAIADVLRQ